jgi:hypothetical protein
MPQSGLPCMMTQGPSTTNKPTRAADGRRRAEATHQLEPSKPCSLTPAGPPSLPPSPAPSKQRRQFSTRSATSPHTALPPARRPRRRPAGPRNAPRSTRTNPPLGPAPTATRLGRRQGEKGAGPAPLPYGRELPQRRRRRRRRRRRCGPDGRRAATGRAVPRHAHRGPRNPAAAACAGPSQASRLTTFRTTGPGGVGGVWAGRARTERQRGRDGERRRQKRRQKRRQRRRRRRRQRGKDVSLVTPTPWPASLGPLWSAALYNYTAYCSPVLLHSVASADVEAVPQASYSDDRLRRQTRTTESDK